MSDSPPPVVESKVALPAVVVACTAVLAGAAYKLALAYGFHPSADQNTAIVGLGAGVQYVLYVVVGFLAPHTPRPDLQARNAAQSAPPTRPAASTKVVPPVVDGAAVLAEARAATAQREEDAQARRTVRLDPQESLPAKGEA